MTYTLLAYFLLTGDAYIEQRGLSLQVCAGQAAISRREYLAALPKLNRRIGEVHFVCRPEISMARSETDTRAITQEGRE